MNNKINIAEKLKDYPKGLKLYSPLFGEVTFDGIFYRNPNYPVHVRNRKGELVGFSREGLFFGAYPDAECLLFPSSKMRDWSKFFKRGDVVVYTHNGCGVLFKGWVDDSFTSFEVSICQLSSGNFAKRDKDIFFTKDFDKASDEQRDKFIADMEKFFDGKYNPETLQVEPVKPVCPFKPFDKVLVRCGNGTWGATFFSRCDNKSTWTYVGVDCNNWEQCIPYNEHTAHLLGTTDPYTEGGSE